MIWVWNVLGISYEANKYDYSCRNSWTVQAFYYTGQEQQPFVDILCRQKKAQKLTQRVIYLRAVLHAPFNFIRAFPSPLLPVASQQYPEARDKRGQSWSWSGNSWNEEGLEEAEPGSDEPSKDLADSSHCCLPRAVSSSWDCLDKTMLQHPLEGFKGNRNDSYCDIFVLSYLLLHGVPSVKFIPVYTCVLYMKC